MLSSWRGLRLSPGAHRFAQLRSAPTYTCPSPTEQHTLFGREIILKRDDLISLPSDPSVTGNKVRKLKGFEDLLTLQGFTTIFSYGGIQSNFLRSISLLAHARHLPLIYFAPPVPQTLLEEPVGNFQESLKNGAKIVSLPPELYKKISLDPLQSFTSRHCMQILEAHAEDIATPSKSLPVYSSSTGETVSEGSMSLEQLVQAMHNDSLFIPQGGYHPLAYEGMRALGQELVDFIQTKDDRLKWTICFASGTGTSAYYFKKFLLTQPTSISSRIFPLVVPCVGDEHYLKETILRLHLHESQSLVGEEDSLLQKLQDALHTDPVDSKLVDDYYSAHADELPSVLSSGLAKKRAFGSLSKTHLQLWESLQAQLGISFDLLYTPRMLELLISQGFFPGSSDLFPSLQRDDSSPHPLAQHRLILYHCGGLEGNPSLLGRYNFMQAKGKLKD